MKHTKRVFSILLSGLFLLMSLSVCFVSFAVTTSGKCGPNLTWTYDDTTKTLTISGNGEMDNYSLATSSFRPPWYTYAASGGITKVVLNEGITKIGNSAFDNNGYLVRVTIPDSVTAINYRAFYQCNSLVAVKLGSGLLTIGDQAFSFCKNLEICNFPESLQSIGNNAFSYCAIEEVTLGKNIVSIGSSAFSNSSVKKLVLGEATEIIEPGAFSFCSLNEVTMYHKISAIGTNAFINNNISNVYFYGSENEWNEMVIGKGNEPLLQANRHFLKPHEHQYTSSGTISATCTMKGVRSFTCTCGDSYTEEIPVDPTNHVHTENRSGLAATCTETGFTAGVYCTDCGKWASGHATIAIDSTNHAALDENGDCPRCGKHVKDVEKPTEKPTEKPDNKPADEQPPENLNFFQRIIQWFRNLFAKLFGR